MPPDVPPVPPAVRRMADRGPDWAAWVDALPRLARDVVEEWDLTPDGGDPAHGFCSLVLPVTTGEGEPAMLKLGFVHEESEHEHLALQRWHGRGAVRLLRADPRRGALLLERLATTDLTDLWDVEACEVVGGLYADLHVPALPQLRRLSSYAAAWATDLATVPREAPLPPRLVAQAASLARSFAADPATDGRLIHTDLHYGNVLAAEGAAWLAIDPKPINGDPHYELAPMLSNRWTELAGAHRPVRDGVRLRFETLVDVAGLDEERARDWVVVRMLVNALGRLRDPAEARRLTPTRDYLTMCVAIAKAVQA